MNAIEAEYAYSLRAEMLEEVEWADGWLRWYFLGVYSEISVRQQEWILNYREQRWGRRF